LSIIDIFDSNFVGVPSEPFLRAFDKIRFLYLAKLPLPRIQSCLGVVIWELPRWQLRDSECPIRFLKLFDGRCRARLSDIWILCCQLLQLAFTRHDGGVAIQSQHRECVQVHLIHKLLLTGHLHWLVKRILLPLMALGGRGGGGHASLLPIAVRDPLLVEKHVCLLRLLFIAAIFELIDARVVALVPCLVRGAHRAVVVALFRLLTLVDHEGV